MFKSYKESLGRPNIKKFTAEENFPRYSKQNSYVERYLTPQLYAKLKTQETSLGANIDQCIQVSVEFTGEEWTIGLIAFDQECYTLYREIFDPVLDDIHCFKANEVHPPPDLDASKLVGGQLDPAYVVSCRVRTARTIADMPFTPAISRAGRRDVERIMTGALGTLTGELAGSYMPLFDMDEATKNQLDEEHLYFHKPRSHFMVNTCSVRDWPDARGIWLNKEKSFVVWLNEEDHCRIISIQKGADLAATFARFCKGLTSVEEKMKANGHSFAWNERLGYVNTCPSNIGTCMRSSVHIKLKHLGEHPKFKPMMKKMGLDVRGTQGEYAHGVVQDSTYDISNFARLNKTEVQFIQHLIDGVNKSIEMEKRLEKGESIDDLLPEGL